MITYFNQLCFCINKQLDFNFLLTHLTIQKWYMLSQKKYTATLPVVFLFGDESSVIVKVP